MLKTHPKWPGSMSLPNNAVVRFDYRLEVDGHLVDTSMEEAAKETGHHDEKRTYRPLTVVLGAGSIIKGLEAHVQQHGEVGKTQTIELPPEEAYGHRDPKLVQNVPLAKFKKQGVTPQVGMTLNMGGRPGTVTRITGGRVRVDLNHDLAGKTLHYEYTLRDVIEGETEKIEAILGTFFPMGGHNVAVTDDTVTVDLPMQVAFDQNWAQGKFRVLQELRPVTLGKNIKFVETYPNLPPQVPEGEEVLSAATDGEEE